MNRYLRDRLTRGDERKGRGRVDYEYDSDYAYEHHDDRDYPMRDRRGSERMSRRDMRYDDYDDRREFEYNHDMHGQDLELSEKDIKKWEKSLENEDGSYGPKFYKDQVIPVAERFGIKFDKFTKDEFVMTVNMMYSDYCKALKDSDYVHYEKPEVYVNMAKAFLCDKDFEGEPYQKLAIYYHDISEFDE